MRTTRARTLAGAAAGLAALLLAGCGDGSAVASSAPGSAAPATLTVFAAASLQSTFTRLGTAFEQAHPGTEVTFSFAGSSDLVSQITAGAPADVFASADTRIMDELTAAGLTAGAPVAFATNALQIATPPGNPAGITSFADLARSGVTTVVCAPQVPCGSAAQKVEQATGVQLHPVSEESSVTDVLGKVESGDADAGLVYVTDVTAAGGTVTGVPFPEAAQAVNTYPITTIADSPHAAAARQFEEFVTGAPGRAVLSAAGFGVPAS